MSEKFVIVGAGHAAGQAIASLRQSGFEGELVVIGEEPYLPYQRPPLSKAYLSGEAEAERLFLRPQKFYDERNVTFRLNVRATALDRANKTLTLEDDAGNATSESYDKLLLTTGSRAREIPIPGADLDGVHYLRTIGDVDAMRAAVVPGANVVIVGGGYIGLETAAVANKLGSNVTVLEMEPRLLSRVTSPEMSAYFADLHSSHGVDIRCDTAVSAIEGDGGKVTAVVAGDERIAADVVIVGIGIIPNIELARDAGIECDNGISVDDRCRTSDPDVFAAGDCTSHPNAILDRVLRLESVHNALEQAKTAAAAMQGEAEAYAQVPWFWSDQYDVKLQMVGLNTGYDQVVVRGNIAVGEAFSVFYLREGRLIAVDAVNNPKEFMACRKFITTLPAVDAAAIADTGTDIKEVLGG